MDKKIILGSLALDLKRAALGYHRNSVVMADRFLREAIKRKEDYKKNDLKPYIVKILNRIEDISSLSNDDKAEYALMYSTLIQNYILQNPS